MKASFNLGTMSHRSRAGLGPAGATVANLARGLRRHLIAGFGLGLIVAASSAPAMAQPYVVPNPANWSYDSGGLITTSSGGALPGSYFVLSDGLVGQGVSVFQANSPWA